MFPYKYTIVDISEGDEVGFKAVIPAFPAIHVLADSPEDLHRAVQDLVNEEIESRQKNKKNIPSPDNLPSFSGNFTLRIKPSLHRRIVELAQSRNTSVNKCVGELLQKGLVQ